MLTEQQPETKVVTPLQAGLAAVDEYVAGNNDQRVPLIVAKVRGLLRGYDARWADVEHEVLSVEATVLGKLYNPDTMHPSRTFRIGGKLDVTLKINGQTIIVDHKTTSEDISELDAPYWKQLRIEGQASHYMLLEWLNGRKADGALWDVVKKPGIAPKKPTAAEVKSAIVTREYFSYRLDDAAVIELQTTGRETLSMYEARLAHDCIKERPLWYFQRRQVPRTDSDLIEYAQEVWDHGQEILSARATGRHQRNSGACMMYKSPCKYLGICSGFDTTDSNNWTRKEQVHNELPTLDGDGRDVLTNSRIKMFQLCRRKEYYSYELGIERLDEEEREALLFGSLFHKGLEAWFKAQMNGGAE